jgi:UDPglucose--hexose-1-phosphate uridylyltransferase
MNEWRKDPFSDRWVIIADRRADRPNEFEYQFQRRSNSSCPFCPGQEHQTPPPLLTLRDPSSSDTSPWHVRVVPNLYPALRIDAMESNAGCEPSPVCLQRPAWGIHEVIIESPRHGDSFLDFSASHASLCLEAWRQRLTTIRADRRFAHAMVFKNVGPLGGASLEHAHSQLIAADVEPIERLRQKECIHRWAAMHGECLFCAVLRQEVHLRERLIMQSSRFVAFCPFASRFPFLVWILRRDHGTAYEDAEAGELGEFSECLRVVLRAMKIALGPVSQNLILQSTPFDSSAASHYHWYLELFPRVTMVAGFEWGSGYFINAIAPEKAAQQLRRDTESAGGRSGIFSGEKNW